jgi:hypothetical protein
MWHWVKRAASVLTVTFFVVSSYLLIRGNTSDYRFTNEGGINRQELPVSSVATGPRGVDPANPRYFTDGSGNAILLAGSHTWFTMQDIGACDPPPVFDYDALLDFVQARGYNFSALSFGSSHGSGKEAIIMRISFQIYICALTLTWPLMIIRNPICTSSTKNTSTAFERG